MKVDEVCRAAMDLEHFDCHKNEVHVLGVNKFPGEMWRKCLKSARNWVSITWGGGSESGVVRHALS